METNKTIDTVIVSRVEALKAMHTLCTYLNDEDGYFEWIELGVPDDPDKSDFIEIASDESYFDEVAEVFYNVIKDYGKYGFFVG